MEHLLIPCAVSTTSTAYWLIYKLKGLYVYDILIIMTCLEVSPASILEQPLYIFSP